jgi:hypothetical protein
MWNQPNKELLDKIPRLYATEDIDIDDKQIYSHFFYLLVAQTGTLQNMMVMILFLVMRY